MSRLVVALVLAMAPAIGAAEPGLQAVTVSTAADGGQTWTLSLQLLVLMTALTLLPALLLAMTAFTRIIIVLAILRQALGTAQTPSNQILIALALFLTFFVMAPVFDRVYADSVAPYMAEQMDLREAAEAAVGPIREFMLGQTRNTDLELFSGLAEVEVSEPARTPLKVLLPAFITSELKTAFQIGFLMFIPFLVIDLVVASVLMSMGMMMLSPLIISLPFKLMLFVLVDGWDLVVGTLAGSFYL